jgi:hypothetical protein
MLVVPVAGVFPLYGHGAPLRPVRLGRACPNKETLDAAERDFANDIIDVDNDNSTFPVR